MGPATQYKCRQLAEGINAHACALIVNSATRGIDYTGSTKLDIFSPRRPDATDWDKVCRILRRCDKGITTDEVKRIIRTSSVAEFKRKQCVGFLGKCKNRAALPSPQIVFRRAIKELNKPFGEMLSRLPLGLQKLYCESCYKNHKTHYIRNHVQPQMAITYKACDLLKQITNPS